MITIQTVASQIVNSDDSLADGYLLVTPSDSFEFLDVDGKKKKISKESIQQNFAAGILVGVFLIAPTLNASQDKSNLYYTVQFFTNDSQWTEYWAIDADGGTLEITAVTQVIVNPVASAVDFIPSDEVSTVSIANGIPRAGATGTLDTSWIIANGATLVYQFTDTSLPGDPLGTPPVGIVMAVGYNAVNDQTYVWAGGRWRVTGG